MKKFALLMAVLMLAVAAFTVSAFEDVTVDDACFDAVNTLTSLEVIKGKTETTFAPDEPVTREQMAMLFTRLYTTVNFENGENMTPFTDLDDPYYNSVIAWCFDAKVINGTTPTTFEPKAHIIYQDALTMACRLLGYTDLTYPLGNITKARLIGLTEGLEGTAYDKELTRGEVAIILYNALEAEGAEIIKENKVKYYSGYPILETVERNFEIAVDVWDFKSETYQVVGTENFNLAGYSKATTDTSYNLVLIDTESDEKVGEAVEMEFEDIAVAEDTNSDDAILAYIEILYRGESLDSKKTVVLSSVINSDLDNNAEIAVYYKKAKNSSDLVAQADKILINGKAFDADEKVYNISDEGVIAPVDNLEEVPVFYQEDANDTGVYAQLVYDVNKDGEVDYIMILPMSFEKVTGLTSKGVYTLKSMVVDGGTRKFETDVDEDEVCELIINAEEVAKNDYVLTYELGRFTVIEEVVEPVVTAVTRRTGKSGNYKYTLATGDVVTFAEENAPVLGLVAVEGTELAVSNKEKALYIINDRVVYTEDATTSGYDAYTYAFFVNKGDSETSVDTEDGTIETVNTLIAFMGGKAVTIPTKESAEDLNLLKPGMMTVIDIEDGKYIVESGIQVDEKNAYDKTTGEGYEIVLNDATLWYDTYAKVQKITDGSATYIIDVDADTELYIQTNNATTGDYESVKRYTMANFPQLSKDDNSGDIAEAVIRVNKDADDKAVSYTLVVAFSTAGDNLSDTDEYTSYRIVLSSGSAVNDKDEEYIVYEVLNPITGAVETLTDEKSSTIYGEGTLVRKMSNGVVTKVSDATQVFTGDNLASGGVTRNLMQINAAINGGKLITVFKGTNKTPLSGSTGTELIPGSVKVVVLDINDNDEFVVDVTEDYTELEGKVVRTFTTNNISYRPSYIVVVPYEWADAAGFADLSAYDEYDGE